MQALCSLVSEILFSVADSCPRCPLDPRAGETTSWWGQKRHRRFSLIGEDVRGSSPGWAFWESGQSAALGVRKDWLSPSAIAITSSLLVLCLWWRCSRLLLEFFSIVEPQLCHVTLLSFQKLPLA